MPASYLAGRKKVGIKLRCLAKEPCSTVLDVAACCPPDAREWRCSCQKQRTPLLVSFLGFESEMSWCVSVFPYSGMLCWYEDL